MHVNYGLCSPTDLPKKQTTVNPSFPKGRFLRAKVWCGVGRGEGVEFPCKRESFVRDETCDP